MLSRKATRIILLVSLLAGEAFAYSPSWNGFIYGDSIAQMDQRPRTLSDVAEAFTEVHMWYRPLTQRVPYYLLYPVFSFQFLPYHIIALCLHMATSVLLYFAVLELIGSEWAAFAAAWFFGVHSINFYTTYDAAFYAEPVMTAAYIGGVWSFLRRRYCIAFCCLVLGLVSKETAVTMLPVFLALLVASGDYRKPELRKRLLALAAAASVAFLLYGAVYLQHFSVEGNSLVSNERADYSLSLNRTLIENYRTYASWIFQMPRTWMTDPWVSSRGILRLQGAFGLLVGLFAVVGVFRGNSRVRLGVLWALVAGLPTLILSRTFVHHAYLPMVGVSLIVGCLFASAHLRFRRPVFAALLLVFVLNQIIMAYRNVGRDNRLSWIAVAANIARLGAATFEGARNELQASDGVLVVNKSRDSEELLTFALGGSSLARFVSGNDRLNLRIVNGDDSSLSSPEPRSTVLNYDGKAFVARSRNEK